ncbi:MAG: methyltransferase domain-containing protein [Candidatus Taylorbacteria bacterium]
MFSDPKHNIEQLNLDPGMVVADVGSGSGHYSLEAAKIVGDKGKVYAIDVQKDLLARLKSHAVAEHLHNIEVIWGNAEKPGGTRVKDAFVDFVFVSNILFQVEDKKTFAKEIKRIVKTNGRVLVVDWADSFGGMGPQREHVVTEAKAKELFLSEGLAFERGIQAGAHHYGLVFRKL